MLHTSDEEIEGQPSPEHIQKLCAVFLALCDHKAWSITLDCLLLPRPSYEPAPLKRVSSTKHWHTGISSAHCARLCLTTCASIRCASLQPCILPDNFTCFETRVYQIDYSINT